MGLSQSSYKKILYPLSCKKEQLTIILTGPESTGKTTILYKMELGEIIDTAHYYGNWAHILNYGNLKIEAFDLCDRWMNIPGFRSRDHSDVTAIIYTINASDVKRLDFIEWTFKSFLRGRKLKQVPLCVLANNMNSENEQTDEALVEVKGKIQEIVNNFQEYDQFLFQECNAKTMDKVNEALQWIVGKLQ